MQRIRKKEASQTRLEWPTREKDVARFFFPSSFFDSLAIGLQVSIDRPGTVDDELESNENELFGGLLERSGIPLRADCRVRRSVQVARGWQQGETSGAPKSMCHRRQTETPAD
ncbi:hypothetical protein NLG97_g3370 [Lecanicillium saksenae]|uniref:Uncharacterized protein n=1 Tax=Lecanicillium saksenae TaxID=468837 RepID=A0ACC1R1M6_9HYPO|nr:hypothetical protein NLG97_g3370 [Lecanicillium saksenae]